MSKKERILNKIKAFVKKLLLFIFNPRLLLCVGIAWMITNGWCYVFVAVGTALHIDWMTAAGAAYMAFLWLPFTPEKIVTVLIAIGLLRAFFPKDEKTLGVLREEYQKVKAHTKKDFERIKGWFKRRSKKSADIECSE